jgi:AraC-like DNA-binding protein
MNNFIGRAELRIEIRRSNFFNNSNISRSDEVRIIDWKSGQMNVAKRILTINKMSLVLIDPSKTDVSNVFRAGFKDYVTYPFVPQEVYWRLLSVVSADWNGQRHFEYCSDPLVEKACELLMERFDYTGTVDDLSRRLGTNRNLLSRRFRAAVGEGPIGWYRRKRLEFAAILLDQSDRRIVDVAMTVGYEDPNNFSTAFRKSYGLTPRAYRNMCRSQRN